MTFRSVRKAIVCMAALLAASCTATGPDDADGENGYRVTLSVTPAEGGGLQRLSLPAEVLINLKRRDLGDVRVLDGSGKALPMAKIAGGGIPETERTTASVPAYPIVGSASMLKMTGMSLQIDADDRARVVRVDGTVDPATAGTQEVVGMLLDTRKVEEPAIAVELDTQLPERQPVTFVVEKSKDLIDWQRLGEKVFFRAGEDTGVLGTQKISLPAVDLADHYLRITWTSATDLLSPVKVEAARITTSQSIPMPRLAVATTPPDLVEPRDVRFAVGFATPISAVRITTDDDSVIPVRLFGRNEREEPWQTVSAGVARNGSALLELDGNRFKSFRIEADKRTEGFSQAPHLELLFQPIVLAVQFNANAPFTLSAGQAGAKNKYLTLEEIMPRDEGLKLSQLPEAAVASTPGDASIVILEGADDKGMPTRNLILWAALVAGAIVLAAAALKLFKANAQD